MSGELVRQNASLERLLEAGKRALAGGDNRAAHEYWRMAAVMYPYEERVWVALLDVLTEEEDREVCLENIIAINPLNPDARRELRSVRRTQRQTQEVLASIVATQEHTSEKRSETSELPQMEDEPLSSPPLTVAIATGVGIGILAVVLGVTASIVVYGGLLTAAP